VRPARLMATRAPDRGSGGRSSPPAGAWPGPHVGDRGLRSANIHVAGAVEVETVTCRGTAAGRRRRCVPQQADLAGIGCMFYRHLHGRSNTRSRIRLVTGVALSCTPRMKQTVTWPFQ